MHYKWVEMPCRHDFRLLCTPNALNVDVIFLLKKGQNFFNVQTSCLLFFFKYR